MQAKHEQDRDTANAIQLGPITEMESFLLVCRCWRLVRGHDADYSRKSRPVNTNFPPGFLIACCAQEGFNSIAALLKLDHAARVGALFEGNNSSGGMICQHHASPDPELV